MKIWKALVATLGLANLAFGAVALVAPGRIAGLIGVELLGPAAQGEIRAVFGGLVLVLGGTMFAALRHPDGPAWLRLLALAFAGLALGRVASLVADGVQTYTLLALLLEAGSAAVLAWDPRRRISA
jgi:hypothetical protein